jgi:phospholipid/cholesterol/gamma-HCH transport system substrate-binding protein
MAIRSFRDFNKRVVSVVFIAVMAAITVFAYAVGQLHLLSGGYTISAVFSDSGGLRTGEDVLVAGVRSGLVTGIRPDFRRGVVVVTMQVDGGVHLGTDTHAQIELTTLLGGRFVKLSSAVAKPYLEDLPERRRQIPESRTNVPFTVVDALSDVTRINQGIDFSRVDHLLDETGKIRTPTQQQLGRMLANFNELAGMLNDNTPYITRLIAETRDITGTLSAKDTELRTIIDAGQTLLTALVRRRDELRTTLGDGSSVVRTLSTAISEHEGQLDSLLSSLHLLTANLAPNMDALNTDLALLGPTFARVAAARPPSPGEHWIEALLTGLGPIQPPGPIAERHPGGGG